MPDTFNMGGSVVQGSAPLLNRSAFDAEYDRISPALAAMDALSEGDRLAVFGYYCRACGGTSGCPCDNQEAGDDLSDDG